MRGFTRKSGPGFGLSGARFSPSYPVVKSWLFLLVLLPLVTAGTIMCRKAPEANEAAAPAAAGKTAAAAQPEADTRIQDPDSPSDKQVQDLRAIGSLLLEYVEKNGRQPFSAQMSKEPDMEGPPREIVCNLSIREIPEKFAEPTHFCKVIPAAELEEELSQGLGRKVSLPIDPRELEWDGKQQPFFYAVMIHTEGFLLTTYFHTPHKAAEKISDNWYRFEIIQNGKPAEGREKAVRSEAG